MGNPTIDLPAEASPDEILAQEENSQFQGRGLDLPAEATSTDRAYAQLIQQRFSQPQPEERGAVSRFAGAAGGSAIGALGGGDAASAVELMTQAAKKSKVLQPLLSAGGGWGEEALSLLHDAAHDWAMGANQVKQWALPDAARKGDIAERGGEIAGGLAGLGGVAALGEKMGVKAFEGLAAHGADALGVGSKLSGALFGAAGLAMTGAGQQAAPVYFHVLAKTGSEEKAIQAAMPALGIGATYALPLGKIIAGAGTGTFGKLLLSGLGEGALGASQAVATDAILKKATGEQMSFLKDGAEAGGFGFLTTTILGMLHMAGAKLGAHAETPRAVPEAEKVGGVAPEPQEAGAQAEMARALPEPLQTSQEAPVAGQAEKAPEVAPEAPGAGGVIIEGPLYSADRELYEATRPGEQVRSAPFTDDARAWANKRAEELTHGERIEDSTGLVWQVAVQKKGTNAGQKTLMALNDSGEVVGPIHKVDSLEGQNTIARSVTKTSQEAPGAKQSEEALGVPSEPVEALPQAQEPVEAPAQRAVISTPERRQHDLSLRAEDLAAEEQLKGISEVGAEGVAAKKSSETEPLTGFLNKNGDERYSQRVIRVARSRPGMRAVRFFVDIRDLTSLNAILGHNDADVVLRDFADAWRKVARSDARPARTGGDEFGATIMLPEGVDPEGIVRRIEGAAEEVLKKHGLDEGLQGRVFGADAGWAEVNKDIGDPLEALKEAHGRADEMATERKLERNPGKRKPSNEEIATMRPAARAELAEIRRRRATDQQPAAEAQEPPKPDATQELLYGGLPPLFQSKKVSSESVKKALDDGIRKRGATPEQAFLATEHAHGEVNEQATKAKILSRRLERAMAKEWGKKAAQGQEAKDRIQEALTNPDAMMSLPDSIREHAIALRAHADQNARTMVDQGMVDTPMAATFEKGQGKHLRRQYQAHSDPEWAQKIEPDVRNRLKSLLVSWAEPLTKAKTAELREKIRGPDFLDKTKQRRELLKQIEALRPNRGDPAVAAQIADLRAQRKALKSELRQKSMPQREAAFELGTRKALQGKGEDQIVAQMEHMLADAKATAESPWAAIGASKLKRKDLSLFTARKGLPEEMRAFLGEVKDPLANYASTVMKQAQVIAAHHKFQAMRADGMGKWLFEEPTIKNGAKYVVEVTSGGNKALEPLTKGKPLYTTQEIADALFKAQPAQNSKAWKMAIATNAFLKAGKTVLSPTTIAKQVWQNFTTALRSGHVTDWPKYTKDAISVLSGKDEAGLLEATRHGLIGESVAGVEYSDLKRTLGDKKLTLGGKELSKPYQAAYGGVKAVNDTMGAAFQYPDAFAKIVAWKSETARLVESGMSEAQAKQHAADIVRNLYPTASRIKALGVVKGVDLGAKLDRYRKQPILGTFMGWNSEKIRTTVELYKLIHQELHSGSPELRANALKRIGWAVAGEAALPASVLAYNMLNGIDKQEDSDRRQHLPPWEQQKNILWLGGKDKGKYLSMSDIDSNAWTTDSMLRLIQGESVGPILEDALRENVAPFIEPSMLSQVLTGLVTGVDTQFLPGNGKLVETRDKDRGSILWDAVKPGLLQSVKHNKGLDFTLKDGAISKQLVGLSGFKPQDYDVRDSLKYSQYNFLDALQEAKDSEPKRRAAFKEASEKAQSAIRLGLKYDEVRSILREKLGNPTIDAILTGAVLPYKPRKK